MGRNITNIDGIKISSIHSGMYKKRRLDLSLVEISKGSSVAGVFTKNKARSDAVNVTEKNLKKRSPRYLIINSGNANAGTGKNGLSDISCYIKEISNITSCKLDEVLVFSTGVIGERIKYKKIINSLPKLYNKLCNNGWDDLSKSILTTDKCTKTSEKRITLNNNKVSITGVAKGSGMINPKMATMLSFVATDIKISKFELNKLLKDITDTTYNMITVDGETSTNDSSIIIATGKSNVDYNSLKKTEKEIFVKNLKELYLSLAQKIVNDGEGATKFIKVNVERVSTKKLAKEIAMSIANSPLFKTAMFAEDPNWGRILCAIGNIESNVNDLSKIEIYIGNNLVFKNNSIYKNYSESKAKKYLKNKNLEINIKYNNGKESAVVWTTDLSYEYVEINAEYRT